MKGRSFFTNVESQLEDIAPELVGLNAFSFNGDGQRETGTSIEFVCDNSVSLLVGYFRDDQRKYAKKPTLETDAAANDYGQAEPKLTNAIRLNGFPLADVHAYHFNAGKHKILLPKGYLIVLGFTDSPITPRNAGLAGADEAVDWLFY
jgi:hypothetical protein